MPFPTSLEPIPVTNTGLLVSLITSSKYSPRAFTAEYTENVTYTPANINLDLDRPWEPKEIFLLQVLIQRCRDMNRDVYDCFIDFSRAFDRVKHTELVVIIKEVGVDSRDVQIIANLY